MVKRSDLELQLETSMQAIKSFDIHLEYARQGAKECILVSSIVYLKWPDPLGIRTK